MNSINADWFGEELVTPFSWELILEKGRLKYSVTYGGTLQVNNSEHLGQFVEGLWEGDVAEIFLGSSDAARYLEINLAPSGAWWGHYFESYRKRGAPFTNKEDVQIESRLVGGIWQASISIPEKLLVGQPIFFHVTAILNSRFISSAPVRDIEPDFHNSSCFKPLIAATI